MTHLSSPTRMSVLACNDHCFRCAKPPGVPVRAQPLKSKTAVASKLSLSQTDAKTIEPELQEIPQSTVREFMVGQTLEIGRSSADSILPLAIKKE